MDDVMKRRMMAGVIDEVHTNFAPQAARQLVRSPCARQTFQAPLQQT